MERIEVLQQKLEHWCAASVRALAKKRRVEYRGHHLQVNDQPFLINAPHLHLDFETHRTDQLRGVADGNALRLCCSDQALHEKLTPADPIAALVFDLLEQIRCESQAPNALPGIRTNLRQRFLFWAQRAATSKLVENDVGLLLFSLNMVCWSRLMASAIPEQIEDLIEHTRWGFAETIGKHLRTLKATLSDQASFSTPALSIAAIIASMVNEGQTKEDQENVNATIRQFALAQTLNAQWLSTDSSLLQSNHGVSSNAGQNIFEGAQEYKVFNSAHDREVEITQEVRPAQLQKLRTSLDKRIRQQSVNVHRVARRLQDLISSPALAGWSFGEEQGYLDSARLSRLISSPDERRLFRQEQVKPKSETIVSILIDNSGSMTHHNLEVASLVDTLARAMDLAGFKTEILGFTTGDWNGGVVAKEWARAGKPTSPGRLNSLRHTVYKAAETPWRRSRKAIAGLLRNDLFREGIDGEALNWAYQRLQYRPERNKFILVISDGSPMDAASIAANHERYLDQHLSLITRSIEARDDIKLCALGVGLDLSAHYSHNEAIDLQQEMLTRNYFSIVDLLKRS